MVMIMFKSVAEGKSGNGIPFEKDRENQGRKLLRKYARRQENLTLEAGVGRRGLRFGFGGGA